MSKYIGQRDPQETAGQTGKYADGTEGIHIGRYPVHNLDISMLKRMGAINSRNENVIRAMGVFGD